MGNFKQCKKCHKVHMSPVIICSLCGWTERKPTQAQKNTATIRAILGESTYTQIPVEVLNRSLADGHIEDVSRGLSGE